MVEDPINNWLKHKQEVASRRVLIPDEDEIKKATSWIAHPDMGISEDFLPGIIKHAGQRLNAEEVANMIFGSYNEAIHQNKMTALDGAILLVNLGNYAKSIISDKEVSRMVRQEIDYIIAISRDEQNGDQDLE